MCQSVIYTVTTLGKGPNAKEPDRSRCVAWFSTFEDAFDLVNYNTGNIYEDGYYQYVVIEQMEPGLYPPVKGKWLFKWDREKARYECISQKNNQPNWFKQTHNFGIG